MYRLESGTKEDQYRYEALCRKLNDPEYCRTRKTPNGLYDRKSGSSYNCRLDVIELLISKGTLNRKLIVEYLAHLYVRSTIKASVRSLNAEGLISYDPESRRYSFLDDENAPLEVGAPIVFMPGLKSQQVGAIVELKELRNRPGEVHPLAKLKSGTLLFVSQDTATIDKSQIVDNNNKRWVMDRIAEAGKRGVGHNDLAKMAYHEGITNFGQTIKDLVKEERLWRVPMPVKRGLGPFYFYREPGSTERITKEMIEEALNLFPEAKKVAEELGIHTSHLYKMMKQYGISLPTTFKSLYSPKQPTHLCVQPN